MEPSYLAEIALARGPLLPAESGDALLKFSLIALGLLVFVGLLVVLSIRFERLRSEALQKVARRLDLRFTADVDSSAIDRFKGMHLFSRGHGRHIKNVMQGTPDQDEVSIFDYRFRTGGGKNSRTIQQTVVALRSKTLDLPKFELRPEGFLHRIGDALGFKDIDFDSHPEFSKAYFLRGASERHVRELFDDALLEFFADRRSICIEGWDDQLVFYRQPSRRAKPEEVQQLMEEALEVFRPFRERTRA